jgi:hypothetical protein
VTRSRNDPSEPVGLDYWIWPGQVSRLGSSLSDQSVLPAVGEPSAAQEFGNSESFYAKAGEDIAH